jgi:UDP-2,3-diacylglucosamine pyrophosphatase LpxH
MHDAIIISDLHLGSDNAQVAALREFLDRIRHGELPTRELILNGDVFDSHDFRRLKRNHWKVLSLLRRMSDDLPITWINGNHDGPAEVISSLIGVEFAEEHELTSGGRKVLVLHGHQFDTFLDDHPVITRAADLLYRVLQRVDPSFSVARRAKRASKTFLRCAAQVQARALAYAAKKGCDAVCCGHTHLEAETADGTLGYFNSGCWTELPCGYLSVSEGQVALCHFVPKLDPLAVV